MRKQWLSLLIAVAVLLSACSQQPGQAPADSSTPTPAGTNTPAIPTQDPNAQTMACEVVSLNPTPGPTEESMFPPVTETDWVLGQAEDPILTITEYSDFQCPYCSQLAPELASFVENHPEDVRVAFRHFPLPSHTLAKPAAYAAEAAGAQEKFWEMHDRIFEKQAEWSVMTADQFTTWLEEQAKDLELDVEKFKQDMSSQEIMAKVDQAQQHGLDIQIPGTPLVLLNGQFYQGPRDQASLESILNLFKLESKQFTYCPPMVIDTTKAYSAVFKTEKGDFTVQLFADQAPLAVNSFVFLAQQNWFDGITFHRVLPDFVAQTGDPSGTGFGGPGYSFQDEITDLKFDSAGMLGMANAGPGSNGSQFFITYKDAPDLDGKYTVFGKVTEGMENVEALSERDPTKAPNLPPGDKILDVEIKEQ